MRNRLRCAATCCALSLAAPAHADLCDFKAINGRSVDDTASMILRTSDYVGLGVVRTVPTPPWTLQQEVEFIIPIKGRASVYLIAPYIKDRIGRHDDLIRQFNWRPNEVRLMAFIKTADGLATQDCTAASIGSKPVADLYRSLVKQAHSAASSPHY